MDETISGPAVGLGVVGRVAGIGQGVEIDNVPVRPDSQQVFDQVGPDKTGAAGDQYLFLFCINSFFLFYKGRCLIIILKQRGNNGDDSQNVNNIKHPVNIAGFAGNNFN